MELAVVLIGLGIEVGVISGLVAVIRRDTARPGWEP